MSNSKRFNVNGGKLFEFCHSERCISRSAVRAAREALKQVVKMLEAEVEMLDPQENLYDPEGYEAPQVAWKVSHAVVVVKLYEESEEKMSDLLELEKGYRERGNQLMRQANKLKRQRLAIDALAMQREADKAKAKGKKKS